MKPACCAKLKRVVAGEAMDANFLKAHAKRCRSLADNADEFTKRRLLELAAKYDKRLAAGGPSVGTRILKAPFDFKETPKHI
jgi:hypothetical protein